MKRPICLIYCLLMLASHPLSCVAQTEFGKALKRKYSFKTVSCYSCHSRKSEVPDDQKEAFTKNAKAIEFLNSFGKEFAKQFKGMEVTKRLKDVKELPSDDPIKKQVVDEMTALFLTTLEEIESVATPDGPTYGELLKEATLPGVKPRKSAAKSE